MKVDVNKKLHGANGVMELCVQFEFQEGCFLALSGQSGSGKTTLLRILAGLEEAEGSIVIGSEVWLEGKKMLAPQKRNIGFVFQDYGLFENMSVIENLLFVNNEQKLAEELLETTELTALKNQYPKHLSGGQKQRVALCRALMGRPKVLFLDEALSALDMRMRLKLQNLLLELNQKEGVSIIMVSHDPSEIYRLASRVLVLEQGKVVESGTPKEVMMKEKVLKGEVLAFDEHGLVTLLVGQQLIEVEVAEEKIKDLKIGEMIVLIEHYNSIIEKN